MRDRTADLLDANQALSQLSYGPVYQLLARGLWYSRPSLLSDKHSYEQSSSNIRSSNRGRHFTEALPYHR